MTLVTLTFDNGPDATVTPRVLDVLADRGLTAGFFVVGTQLQQPGAVALAQRAVAEGHWVGNHSMHHKVPLGDEPDPAYADAEITATQRLLDEAGVTHTERYFRPFGRGGLLGPHLLSPRARDLLVEGGYTCVLWNSVPRDWEDPAGWVDTARSPRRRTERAHGGGAARSAHRRDGPPRALPRPARRRRSCLPRRAAGPLRADRRRRGPGGPRGVRQRNGLSPHGGGGGEPGRVRHGETPVARDFAISAGCARIRRQVPPRGNTGAQRWMSH
ncbi:MAG: polysaccharide deacetylase family protein [Acidimicrobiales bacterium]